MILTQLIVRAPGLLNLSIGLSYTIPLKDTEREEKVAGDWILCLPILLNTIERYRTAFKILIYNFFSSCRAFSCLADLCVGRSSMITT